MLRCCTARTTCHAEAGDGFAVSMLGCSTATKLTRAGRMQGLLLSHVPRLPCASAPAPHTKQQGCKQQRLGVSQGDKGIPSNVKKLGSPAKVKEKRGAAWVPEGVPACLAACGWECNSTVKDMAAKNAMLATDIINYAAPLSWGRASAWYVLLEAPEEAALLPCEMPGDSEGGRPTFFELLLSVIGW